MELNTKIFNKLVSFIEESKKRKDIEFEARFKNAGQLINESNFQSLFQHLTFETKNNGNAYPYFLFNTLDVSLEQEMGESIRMSVEGTDSIKKFWINENLADIQKKFIIKEKLDRIDESNYGIRFSLNNELPQSELLQKNMNLLSKNTANKVYRLKNRYSIQTPNKLFSIDMTTVKNGIGKTFRESNTFKSNPEYEIEMEFIGKSSSIDSETILGEMLSHITLLLKILQGTTIILSNREIQKIKNNYSSLARAGPMNFIAANPVTIHRENLLKGTIIKNVLQKYAITLKADGERHFLYVNPEEDGKVFLFNNNFEMKFTGHSNIQWKDTLIEGELVAKNFYAYDILFQKGVDVRKKPLVEGRIPLIDAFLKEMASMQTDAPVISLHSKKYMHSLRADGTDIFDKVREMWEGRKYSPYHVDGVIFVPKYEPYPVKSGSWHSLFKWKPPELNTIDFLMKLVHDDNGDAIKSPYLESIARLDGTFETKIRPYKTGRLYVTGEKDKKRVPLLFNPFGLNEEENEKYNIVKIFLEDGDHMFATDPLSKERVEIFDDSIIEFGYDPAKEDGFQWIPYRFRRDKTSLYKKFNNYFGNGANVAMNIYQSIQEPVTTEMITTGRVPIDSAKGEQKQPYYIRNSENIQRERYSYQNFHNHYVKYELLYLSARNLPSKESARIFDMCCGKGVDIGKIKRAKYTEIVGMDIDFHNIKEAIEIHKKTIHPPRAYYIRGDASQLIFPNADCCFTEADKLFLRKNVPSKYLFDTVSLQFCFHYFFKDEIALRTVLQNINDNLKIGGYFIGTAFDGNRVDRAFQEAKSNVLIGKNLKNETFWTITKKYDMGSKRKKLANYGAQIDVLVKTIGVTHTEFLINFEFVEKIMEDYGFKKIFVKSFEELYGELRDDKMSMDLNADELAKDKHAIRNMSEDEKRFSFFNNAFMFQKVKNSSDTLFRKLVEKIEKNGKIKKGVVRVNDKTEHLIESLKESISEPRGIDLEEEESNNNTNDNSDEK